MANNLQLSYQGAGANLYAIIREAESPWRVWNLVDGTWATWANADIDECDIVLADQGGDVYAPSSEPSITAGTAVRVLYYERAGATPAITDTLLRVARFRWDSTDTGSEPSVDAYALTTLASVKRHLRIDTSGDDVLLAELINGVSAQVERVTGCKFAARDYQEWYRGPDGRKLTLRQWPVLHVNRISHGTGNAFTVRYTGSGIRASAGVYTDAMRLQSNSTTGASTVTTLSFASYGSTSALVDAINAVSGWTAALSTNVPTLELHRVSGRDATDTLTFTYPADAELDYRIMADTGVVEIPNSWLIPGYNWRTRVLTTNPGPDAILVEYRAGYETIPADVQMVANRLVQDAYYTGLTDRGMTKQTLGPFSWTASPKEVLNISAELAHYIDRANTMGLIE